MALAAAQLPLLRFLAILLGIYVIPVMALLMGVIPFRLRFQTLVALTVVAVILAFQQRYSLSELGFRAPTSAALVTWTLGPALAAVMLGVVFKLLSKHPASESVWFYLFFILVSAPAQEFLYRGFLFAHMDSFGFAVLPKVLLSASLYALMHIIYRDITILALTFSIGLLWAWAFSRTGSLPLVITSHALVGAVAILMGMI